MESKHVIQCEDCSERFCKYCDGSNLFECEVCEEVFCKDCIERDRIGRVLCTYCHGDAVYDEEDEDPVQEG